MKLFLIDAFRVRCVASSFHHRQTTNHYIMMWIVRFYQLLSYTLWFVSRSSLVNLHLREISNIWEEPRWYWISIDSFLVEGRLAVSFFVSNSRFYQMFLKIKILRPLHESVSCQKDDKRHLFKWLEPFRINDLFWQMSLNETCRLQRVYLDERSLYTSKGGLFSPILYWQLLMTWVIWYWWI